MDTPLNMIIGGMTNCGKTYYLLKMLDREFKNHFDYILLVFPTFSWNKTYQEWKYINDKDLIPIECEQDDVDKVLHIISNIYRGTNSLIILDDCASGQDVKNRASELVKLAFSARHFGLSTIVITQQLTCTIYNMSGRVVSDIQARAEGECLSYPIEHGRECCKWLVKFISKILCFIT